MHVFSSNIYKPIYRYQQPLICALRTFGEASEKKHAFQKKKGKYTEIFCLEPTTFSWDPRFLIRDPRLFSRDPRLFTRPRRSTHDPRLLASPTRN
jgi:hypothetical protein